MSKSWAQLDPNPPNLSLSACLPCHPGEAQPPEHPVLCPREKAVTINHMWQVPSDDPETSGRESSPGPGLPSAELVVGPARAPQRQHRAHSTSLGRTGQPTCVNRTPARGGGGGHQMVTSKTHQGPDLLTTCPRRSPHVLTAFPSQSNAVRGERAHFTDEKTELRVRQSLSKGLRDPRGRREDALLNFSPLTGTLTQGFRGP